VQLRVDSQYVGRSIVSLWYLPKALRFDQSNALRVLLLDLKLCTLMSGGYPAPRPSATPQIGCFLFHVLCCVCGHSLTIVRTIGDQCVGLDYRQHSTQSGLLITQICGRKADIHPTLTYRNSGCSNYVVWQAQLKYLDSVGNY
jgi:hypothetical protein